MAAIGWCIKKSGKHKLVLVCGKTRTLFSTKRRGFFLDDSLANLHSMIISVADDPTVETVGCYNPLQRK
jgi:hypothetical protein